MVNNSFSPVRWRSSIIQWTIAVLLVLGQTLAQDGVSSSYGQDFYIGFMRNIGGGSLTNLRLLIGTDADSVGYVVEARDRIIQTGTVSSGTPVVVTVPSDPGDLELQIIGDDFDNREKGIHVYTTGDESIFVIGENFISLLNYGSFLAYPCFTIETNMGYEYYITSVDDVNDFLHSQFLLVGCENDTTITVTPTQTISLPQDPQMAASTSVVIDPASTSHMFTLNQMQTLLVSSVEDLTGTKIVSNKPLTVISGHECANVPGDSSGCEPLAVHVPPAATWGTGFLLAPFAGRTSVQRFKILSAVATTVRYTCGTTSNEAESVTSFVIETSDYCYLESLNPLLVVQLSTGGSIDSLGDPAVSMISPIDQYINEITFFSLATDSFPSNFISVTVSAQHYDPQNILLDGAPIDCTWNDIQNSAGEIVGYGCSTDVSSSAGTPAQHTVSHMDADGLISVLAYGFSVSPAQGYAYLTGQRIQTMDDGANGDNDDVFFPFFNLTAFPGVMELDNSQADATSPPITIPNGLIFGDRLVTTVYINENGVISFDSPWRYSLPDRFPTDFFPTRQSLAIAPFWSDNDIRREGAVRYGVYCIGSEVCDTHTEGATLLTQANQYIQSIQVEGEEQFQGTMFLAVHWDNVHPSPHGQDDHLGIPEEELNLVNSYQAIVVSNVVTTYVVFTYICGDIQWSSVGSNRAAVVGFNAEGNVFDNHPLSGFPDIGDAISCTPQMMGNRRKRQNMNPNNMPMQIPANGNLRNQILQCQNAVTFDGLLLTATNPLDLATMLEPCPCYLSQATADYGRFRQQDGLPGCFISTNPLERLLPASQVSLTQQCCYDNRGALLKSRGENVGTNLLFDPESDTADYLLRDRGFRDACCSFGMDAFCNQYFNRRVINDCTGYSAPSLGIGWGDPHYTTFDGRRYNFQGLGDYVLLEVPSTVAGAMPLFTIQGRLGRPTGWRRVTGHVGLAFGNEDVAFQLGMSPGFRVFQTKPDSQADREITNELPNRQAWEIPGKALLMRDGNTLRAAFYESGVTLLGRVFPLRNNELYMNFEVRVPRSYSGRTRGFLGNMDRNQNNDYFRRDGTPIPGGASERLLLTELDTWEVTTNPPESLFFNPMIGRRKRQADEEPIFADEMELNVTDEQRMICGDNEACLFDLFITDDMEIAVATLGHEDDAMETMEVINNFPPVIMAQDTFVVTVGQESMFHISVEDPGDVFTLTVQDGLPVNSVLEEIAAGLYIFRWNLMAVTTEPLVFIATDEGGASSVFMHFVQVCACTNGGQCVFGGLLPTDPTVVLNCQCTDAYSGRFCEEDRDGCLDIECFEGVGCTDVPAPGVGAECGACPSGYVGDADKCYDIDECSLDDILCEQLCVNTDGGFTCACMDGFQLIEGTNQCEDIDECGGVNDCQQVCDNTQGSFVCSCNEGFTLGEDGRSCTADVPCGGECSFGCAVINGEEQCFCPIGFELSVPGGTQCVDIDECEDNPCDQECSNTEGSFVCSCQSGYELQADGTTCEDIDECLVAALDSMNLCQMNSRCVNSLGGFDCVCVSGYVIVEGSCERITCPSLEDIADGSISYSSLPNADGNYVSGTVATYSCNVNYGLVGMATRLCGDAMEWSGSAPTCELIMCPNLAVPENGGITYAIDDTAPFDATTIATYHCNDGYALSGGDVMRTCVGSSGDLNGVWDGVAPTCEAITCPPLAIPPNSALIYTLPPNPNYALGTLAIHFCDPQYSAVSGDVIRTCIADGMTGIWSGEEPVCASIVNGCPDIADPANGNIDFSGDTIAPFQAGTTASYNCDQGFSLDGGDTERTCGLDNVWSGSAPSCAVITCEPLDDVANGNAITYGEEPNADGNFPYGTEASFSCMPGFGIVGSMTSICGGDGSSLIGAFEPASPTCEPISCALLPAPVNGQVTQYDTLPDRNGNLPFETIAIYSCMPGFGVTGDETRECVGDGSSIEGYFDGNEPVCEEIMCPDLSNPENGQIDYSMDPLDIGTAATYSCDPGFALDNGDEMRTCEMGEGSSSVGVWSGMAPICVGTCPLLSIPVNGATEYSMPPEPNSEYLSGSVATYSCIDDLQLFGNEVRTCQDDGTWTGSDPTCEIACLGLNGVLDGTISYSSLPNPGGYYVSGTVALYNCNDNFRLFGGGETRMCEDSMEWTGTDPTCEMIQCPDLSDPENGDILFATDTMAPFDLMTIATYVCDEGFVLSGGDEERTCIDNGESPVGEWIGESPICERITCPALALPENFEPIEYSSTPNPDYAFGTTAEYSCNPGFTVVAGDVIRTCYENGDSTTGVWSGEEPVCEAIVSRCPHIPNPENGVIDFADDTTAPFEVGTTATYSCDPGFDFEGGDIVRTCEGDGLDPLGAWSGEAPSCVAVSFCPLLTVPENAAIDYSTGLAAEFEFGTIALYSCSEGFGINGGDAMRTCGADGIDDTVGVWSGDAPSCDPIQCPDIADPFDGQIEFELDRTAPFDYGTVATYSCDNDFILSPGNPIRSCGGDGSSSMGEWSETALICLRQGTPVPLPLQTRSVLSDVDVQFVKSSYEISEGASDMICVEVFGELDKALFVSVSTVDGDAQGSDVDYVDISESLTFIESNDKKCLSLATIADDIYEKNEQFQVQLSVIDPPIFKTSTVIIKDDDSVFLSLLVDKSVCEGTDSVSVCVKLESAIEEDVEALVETSDGSFAKDFIDYKKSANTFIFSALTPSQFVLCSSIDIVDDNVAEPREDFIVTLSSSTDRAIISGPSSQSVVIDDDDGVSGIYLTNHSPQISGTSLNATFTVDGCAKVTCAIEDGASADCSPELGSFDGHWFVPHVTDLTSVQTLHLTVEPCCGQAPPTNFKSREFRTDNRQCSLHFTDGQYSVDPDSGDVTVEWEGTGPSQLVQVSSFSCKIDGGESFSCSSPQVIPRQKLSAGENTLNVTPESISDCLHVIGQYLLIDVSD